MIEILRSQRMPDLYQIKKPLRCGGRGEKVRYPQELKDDVKIPGREVYGGGPYTSARRFRSLVLYEWQKVRVQGNKERT